MRRLLLVAIAEATSAHGTHPRARTTSIPAVVERTVSVDSATVDYTVAGVHVIQRQRVANDVVAVNLYLLGGVQQLTPATAGIEALALHAAEYGSARYPGPLSRRAMARTGSVSIVSPSSDWTLIGFRGIAEQFDSTWAVFADRLVHPTLDSNSVRVARQRMLLAARARGMSPDGALWQLADSVAFVGHPYALDPDGNEMSLAELGAPAVQQYVRDAFVTSRMLLIIVGNVPRSTVEAAVTATIGTLPPGSYVWHPPPPVPRHPASFTAVQRPTATNYLLGFFQGPAVTSPDYPAFELATELLGARLSTAIRQDRSLSYAVSTPVLDRALATGGVYVSTPAPARVMPLITQFIDSVRGTPIQRMGLRFFTRQFVTSHLAANSTNTAQAGSLGIAQIYRGDYHQADATMSLLGHVSPGDLQQAARTYIRDIQFVYLGDTARAHGIGTTRFSP